MTVMGVVTVTGVMGVITVTVMDRNGIAMTNCNGCNHIAIYMNSFARTVFTGDFK